MNEFTTCFCLWCKRFLKRPLFLFTLLLMPASVLFLENSHTKQDAVIRVALYAPDDDADQTSKKLVQTMVSLSNSAIRFYKCSNPKILKNDVATGKAACGYIFPKNLNTKLRSFIEKQTPYILAIRLKEDMRTRIVDEILLSKLYQPLSYHRLSYFLSQKQDISSEKDWLQNTYEKHNTSELLFRFEYANGEDNPILNDSHSNYMMMPIRGIVSVMILLSCLTGGLFRYSDKKNIHLFMNIKKSRICNLLSLLVPGIFSGITGLVTIKMTGISASPATEIPVMILYLLCCMSLSNLLYVVFEHQEFYLAAIPVLVISSLIFSPVFINLESFVPELAPISRLFPTTHYLAAIYTSSSSIVSSSLIISSSVLLFCSVTSAALYSWIKG